jgi:hypothetical protein
MQLEMCPEATVAGHWAHDQPPARHRLKGEGRQDRQTAHRIVECAQPYVQIVTTNPVVKRFKDQVKKSL